MDAFDKLIEAAKTYESRARLEDEYNRAVRRAEEPQYAGGYLGRKLDYWRTHCAEARKNALLARAEVLKCALEALNEAEDA